MEIRFRGVIALSDEPLRRAVSQKTLDFRPKSIQFAFARPFGPTKGKTGSSLGYGWAMSQILAGGNPASVTASHRPSIVPTRRAEGLDDSRIAFIEFNQDIGVAQNHPCCSDQAFARMAVWSMSQSSQMPAQLKKSSPDAGCAMVSISFIASSCSMTSSRSAAAMP